MTDIPNKKTLFDNLLLYGALILYSCGGILSKLAAGQPVLSIRFILYYLLYLVLLAAYAFIWQKVLARFELSRAYANKPIVTVLSMLWGILFFHEQFKWNMVLGAAIILVGIRIVVTDHG